MEKKKILFIGDSLTDYCSYISILETYFSAHPSEGNYEFVNVGVGWETASGLSEPPSPFPRPCVCARIDKILARVQPDWAVVLYGINDGIYYPPSQAIFDAYHNGITTIVEKLRACGSKVALMTPPPFEAQSYNGALFPVGEKEYGFMRPYVFYNDVMESFADWIRTCNLADKVIDTRSAIEKWLWEKRIADPFYKAGDGLHYNVEGNFVIAETILREFFCATLPRNNTAEMKKLYKIISARQQENHRYIKETIGHDSIEKDPVLPPQKLAAVNAVADKKTKAIIARSTQCEHICDYNGFARYDFSFDGRAVIVVEPKRESASGGKSNCKNSACDKSSCDNSIRPTHKKWQWRTEFFGIFDDVDIAMLDKGYYLVYYSISDLYGSPKAINLMDKFYNFITAKLQLDEKTNLIGHSRGGLYAIHFAAKFPQRVGAMFLDVPVVDIRSWPAKVAPREWKECKALYGLTDETSDRYAILLKKALENLTENKVPLVLVSADSDSVVPFEENSKILVDAYQNSCAKEVFEHIAQKGDHHSHISKDVKKQVEFLLKIAQKA
ncbi:MAG: alpha/beta fold hydrolase [Clostridia bacterium]